MCLFQVPHCHEPPEGAVNGPTTPTDAHTALGALPSGEVWFFVANTAVVMAFGTLVNRQAYVATYVAGRLPFDRVDYVQVVHHAGWHGLGAVLGAVLCTVRSVLCAVLVARCCAGRLEVVRRAALGVPRRMHAGMWFAMRSIARCIMYNPHCI